MTPWWAFRFCPPPSLLSLMPPSQSIARTFLRPCLAFSCFPSSAAYPSTKMSSLPLLLALSPIHRSLIYRGSCSLPRASLHHRHLLTLVSRLPVQCFFGLPPFTLSTPILHQSSPYSFSGLPSTFYRREPSSLGPNQVR